MAEKVSAKISRQFRGRFELKLDTKGRLTLPSTYLQSLEKSGKLVVTNSRFQSAQCLQVYRWNEWLELEKKIDSLNPLEPAVQAFNRFYLSAAQELELDAQNRIVIPQTLRKYAGLEGEAVLVGLGDKFEMWDIGIWNKVFGQLTENFEDIQKQVSDLIQGVKP